MRWSSVMRHASSGKPIVFFVAYELSKFILNITDIGLLINTQSWASVITNARVFLVCEEFLVQQ